MLECSVCALSLALHCICDAGAIGRIALNEEPDLSVLDFLRNAMHGGSNVVEQALPLSGIEQTKQIAGLRVVVITVAVAVAVSIAVQGRRRFAKAFVFFRTVERIPLVVG